MSDSSQRFVADHVGGLPRSGIRDFFAIVSAMPQAISLGIGEPDFVTPWHIREAAIFALEKGKTSYTDNLGLIRLRSEIIRYVENNFGLSYHPEKEVLVAVGVSEALDIALRAVLNPGDKVLYHEPCYVSYMPSIRLAHAEPIAVATTAEDEFGIDPDRVAAAWEPGCKVLLLNFPTNPTGGVTERAKLEKLARFAVEKDLLVISDEIYSELTFEGEHVSIATLPYAGAHNLSAWIFQGLCHDRISHRLRLWSAAIDRGDDEDSSIQYALRSDPLTGGGNRGAEKRYACGGTNEGGLCSQAGANRAPFQRDGAEVSFAPWVVLRFSLCGGLGHGVD